MKYWILFCALTIQLSTFGQADSAVVPFSARWKTGDLEYFRVTKVKKTWQDRKLVQNDSTQYIAEFRVLETDNENYTIRWKLKNPLLQGFNLPQASYEKLSKIYDTTTIIYLTSRHGAFRGVINWKETSMMITDMLNELIRLKSEATKKDPAEIRNNYLPLLSVYSSKRGIEQLVFNELQIFHFPFGNQYTIGQLYGYTEELPVMQNMEPITGSGVVFVRKFNRKLKECELVQRMKISPDTAKIFLKDYFKKVGVLPGGMESTLRASQLEINDNNIFLYTLEPLFPVNITVERETLIYVLDDKIRQTDKTLIEKVSY